MQYVRYTFNRVLHPFKNFLYRFLTLSKDCSQRIPHHFACQCQLFSLSRVFGRHTAWRMGLAKKKHFCTELLLLSFLGSQQLVKVLTSFSLLLKIIVFSETPLAPIYRESVRIASLKVLGVNFLK